MSDTRNVKNSDPEATEKTGSDFFDKGKDETSKTTKKTDLDSNIINETEEEITEQGTNPTPFELSRIRYYNSEKKKNEAKSAVLGVLKYLIPIFATLIIGLLAVFGGIESFIQKHKDSLDQLSSNLYETP